jgi:hypothetical protein
MNRSEASAALQSALELSRKLAAAADSGDIRLAVRLDAERLQLLKSARAALQPMDEKNRAVLEEIAELNDRALGFMEHHRRSKARALDTAATGRRAVAAYAHTRVQR